MDIAYGFSRALNGAQIAARLVGVALALRDVDLTIVGDLDATKKLAFQVDTQATASVVTLDVGVQTASRTIRLPVVAGTDTLAALGIAQTFTGAQTFNATLTLGEAVNIPVGTTTGTKIGTATTQKLGFFNATPVVQQTGDVATALTSLGLVATPTVRATDGLDGTFFVKNTADTTKQFKWSLSGNTTGIALTLATAQTTAQTLNVPNITGTDTIATLGLAQTFAGSKTFSAQVLLTAGTASTTPLTGTLVVTGGVGITGAVWTNGKITISQPTDPGFALNATGIGKTWNSYIQSSTNQHWISSETTVADWVSVTNTTGFMTLVSTTASTSTTTGSLVAGGGIGLAGQLTFDGATGKSLRVTNPTANAATATTLGSVGPTGSTAGNPQGWLRISAAGTDRYIPFW
jgi:hypothetical protein